ncbi:MAG: protein N-lysine methyltransferase family protein [Rubripirellula sp.]|nr:protein N-lysine methyltransferase family protein [Rubripirellula sp.]
MSHKSSHFSELNFDELVKLANSGFPWHWEPTTIANRQEKIAVASDPDGMLLDACRRQDAGEQGVIDPFWATTWRAAAGLDHYLDNVEVSGKRVLEVGCGTGHVGFSAALRGARVTLTDGVADPLLLVHLSTWPVRDRCEVKQLRFGIDQLEGEKFPIILGSDVTYLRQLWPELIQCLDGHLAPGGTVYLSDPFRIIANEFSEWIKTKPWQYSESPIELPDDNKHPIRIMRLSRSKSGC